MARSVPQLRLATVVRRVAGAWVTSILLTTGSLAALEVDRPLQLEVFINDAPAQLIGSFVSVGGHRIGARRDELEEIGLAPPGNGASAAEVIVLDELPGLSYRYDVPGQRIFITATDALRAPKTYQAVSGAPNRPSAQADFGGVLNYNLFASSVGKIAPGSFDFSGVSATLDSRVFSPYGTLSQSGILRGSSLTRGEALRLDTTFAFSDPETLRTYRAGDVVSGGFAWTRPIRMGGLQVQRTFALRPDLVTLPLPSVSGSAAVPSTADVYVNNLKTYSQEIAPGPYRITNIPMVSGGGEARVVLRDASGRETQTTIPLFASPRLLAPGLYDYSFETGVARLGYATPLDGYADSPVASGSWRQGVFDWLTLEGHAEGGGGVVNGGAGAVIRTGSFGVASVALSASGLNRAKGLQSFVSYETQLLGVNFYASSQMSFGDYEDLASATARSKPKAPPRSGPVFDLLSYDLSSSVAKTYSSLLDSAKVPKMANRISAGTPLPFDSGSVSVSYIDLKTGAGDRSRIVTASYSRPLPYGASFNATAFTDLAGQKSTGLFVGLSIPLGGGITASTVASSSGTQGRNVLAEAAKPLGPEPDSVGWRVRGSPGGAGEQSAAASYRSAYGWAEAGVGHVGSRTTATAQLDGAIATLGGGVFATSRVDDSFAVVETGVPGLGVLHENRPVGVTDSNGRLLVPGLRSYEQNRIAIDASNLPITAQVTTTQDLVAPASRSGVRLDFGVRTNIEAAILILSKPDGTPVEAGARGQLEGGEPFVVGYDGRSYVKGLARDNSIVVEGTEGPCRAAFTYGRKEDAQVVIPIVCR